MCKSAYACNLSKFIFIFLRILEAPSVHITAAGETVRTPYVVFGFNFIYPMVNKLPYLSLFAVNYVLFVFLQLVGDAFVRLRPCTYVS